VWQHVQAVRLGYRLERSRSEASLIKGRIDALQSQLENELAPARLAQAATSRLGMEPGFPGSLRFLETPAPLTPVQTLLSRWLPKSWRSSLHT
jgi:hypothetical protein